MDSISLPGASIDYDVTVYSLSYDRARSSATVTYGPGPAGAQYLATGDPALMGVVDQRFSLLHTAGASGLYSMQLQTSAVNRSESRFNWQHRA